MFYGKCSNISVSHCYIYIYIHLFAFQSPSFILFQYATTTCSNIVDFNTPLQLGVRK